MKPSPPERTKLRPRQVAAMYGLRVGRVLAWIKSGELRAIDVSAQPGGPRPRYLVDRADLAAFDERRTVRRREPQKRRRPEPASVIQFV